MLIREAATLTKKFLTGSQTLKEAYQLLAGDGLKYVPVFQGQELAGIISRDHFFGCQAVDSFWELPVSQLMTVSFAVIPETLPLAEAWKIPGDYWLLINSGGKYCGILSRSEAGSQMASLNLKQAKQLESILDSAHNGVIAIDFEGRVIYFNQAAEQIVWRKQKDVIGKHLSEVVIPLGLLDILKTGQPQLSHKFTVEYSTGKHVYLTHRTPIYEGERVAGAVGVFQDVSEIEVISQELQIVKRLYQELEGVVEGSFDGILICDPEGKVLRANSASERLLGCSKNEMSGKFLSELLPEEYKLSPVVERISQSSATSTIMINTGDHQLLLTGNPLLGDAGQVEQVILNVRDLTELNSLRLQLEKSKNLSERYHSELSELRSRLLEQEGILVQSGKMQKIISLTLRVAQVDSTVLITGESGVGKEIITKIIHKKGKRTDGPFIKINCGAIPENLLESELFGYEPGAFTGASKEGKLGMFELAHHGTLFLDEIGELPLALQVKLLRAIQDREINRVGGNKLRRIDVRIIAATNRNLTEMVRQGQFREDLYFRLNVIPINIPPLRERQEEIIPLARQFMAKFCKAYNLKKDLSPEVMEAFLDYQWPGNIRELENVIERLVVTTPDQVITINDLPQHFVGEQSLGKSTISIRGLVPLKRAVLEVEKQLLEKAMERYGSTYKAAEVLQVDQSTIVRKLNKIKQSGFTV